MSEWYIARLSIGSVKTDFSGSGLTEQEAMDNMGLNLDLVEKISKLLRIPYSVCISSGFKKYVYLEETK